MNKCDQKNTPENSTKAELVVLVSEHFTSDTLHLRFPDVISDFTYKNKLFHSHRYDID